MGLMNNIRQNTHIMLWILILAFVGLIVFEWGASFSFNFGQGKGQPKNLAKINGETVSPQHYFQLLQNQYDQARQQSGGQLTDQQRNQIQEQLWNQLVNETLIQQAVKERHIVVTDQDIIRELRNNPPDFLKSVEAFQTDGKFDYQKYLNALNHPVGDEWVSIENYVRASLPARKLESTILASVSVSENEIKQEYLKNNTRYTTEYLFFPTGSISDEEAKPSEQEIQTYYRQHLDEFQVPEKRVIQYASFPKTPSHADTVAAHDLAMEVLNQAKAGSDFGELAREYSDGPSASNGGDLGWFSRGQMVPAFEKAAFSTKKGRFAGPVLTQFGYHVIYVRDKRTQNGEEQIQASHILINIEASPSTIDEQRSQASLFLFDAQDYSFEASADSNHVTIHETQPFEQDATFIPGLTPVQDAVEFAYKNSVGALSDVVDTESGFYVFRLSEIQQPYVQKLEKARGQISQQLTEQKKQQLAYQKAQQVRQTLSDSTSLEEVGSTNKLATYRMPDPFTIAGSIPGVGQSPEFKGAVEALNSGEISPAIQTSQGAYIIRLVKKSPFNQQQFAQQEAQIRQRLLTTKQNQFMNNWIQSLRAEAKIVDNRSAFL